MLDFHENRELEPLIRNVNYNNLNFKTLWLRQFYFLNCKSGQRAGYESMGVSRVTLGR